MSFLLSYSPHQEPLTAIEDRTSNLTLKQK